MAGCTTHASNALRVVLVALMIATALPAFAQTASPSAQQSVDWNYGAFIDVGRLFSSTSPSNHAQHLFGVGLIFTFDGAVRQ